MAMSYPPLAFVDLETTGMAAAHHRILEIGIVAVDDGRVTEWSSLVNPGRGVPAFTRSFTGISDEMIADAPRFEQIAQDVEERLRGRLFIAHNARFDHGFLRNEFKRLAIEFDPRVLCTVRLSRKLYPQFARHDLDSLMQRHGLSADARHRAAADAQLIWQFWQAFHQELPAAAVADAIQALLTAATLPPQLDPGLIRQLPEAHGAYVLYGDGNTPLYVGKARNLRQRVLAHFGTDRKSAKAEARGRRVNDVEWHATSGELGARLKAAMLTQALLPAASRRLSSAAAPCAWRLAPDSESKIAELVWMGGPVAGSEDLFGLFASERKAKNALCKLARTHRLCRALLGLQSAKSKPQLVCQAAPCDGTCERSESRRLHLARFISAAARIRIKAWPYPGAIAIREGSVLHLADRWCYLGAARSEDEIWSLLESHPPGFDLDVFKLLQNWLARCPRRLITDFARADGGSRAPSSRKEDQLPVCVSG